VDSILGNVLQVSGLATANSDARNAASEFFCCKSSSFFVVASKLDDYSLNRPET
jgi:hypothetical protein